MGKTNRAVVKATDGSHKDHILIANRHTANYAGKRLVSTILRCYTCFKTVGNDFVSVEQEEYKRKRFR